MNNIDMQKHFLKGVLIATLACGFIFVAVQFFVKQQAKIDQEIQLRNERKQRHIAECNRRGGFWTPVGGTHYDIVYGCVFPPERH
jgi:hypothetical protein